MNLILKKLEIQKKRTCRRQEEMEPKAYTKGWVFIKGGESVHCNRREDTEDECRKVGL